MRCLALLYLAPGGPLSEIIVRQRQSARYPIRPDDIERLKSQYDLDLPLWQAYTRWAVGWPNLPDRAARLWRVRGDFGESWRLSEHEPTMRVILRALPNTLKLTIAATLLSLLVGVSVGVLLGGAPILVGGLSGDDRDVLRNVDAGVLAGRHVHSAVQLQFRPPGCPTCRRAASPPCAITPSPAWA